MVLRSVSVGLLVYLPRFECPKKTWKNEDMATTPGSYLWSVLKPKEFTLMMHK